MEFGPDDLVMVGIRWLASLFLPIITSVAILGIIAFGRRRRPHFRYWPALVVCLVPVPLVCWVIQSAATSKLTYTLTLLNSESSQVAESTYEKRFRVEVGRLDEAVRLAISKHKAPNVRFYASCLVSDILATNEHNSVIATTLSKVEGAPIIKTQFFGGNRLTDKFYIPGQVQPHLSVRDIVEQRLRDLRKMAQP